VFFAYDSAELDVGGRAVVQAAAEVLRTSGSWIVAIEGHCDERGTAEYNLALGGRRVMAVQILDIL
jgi:peptidoglycan-associated lipoprotein